MDYVNYNVCTRCVMDTSDHEITFDVTGVCSHCKKFDEVTRKGWFPNEEGAGRLQQIIEQIKLAGRNKEYDSILGLSGGIDSSYMALKAYQWGLRPLVVHVDGGWNSELAVANIEKIVKYCGYHLYTHVVDWEEMRDLQLAYLRAGVANQDVPQDHVIFASMYHFAVEHGIQFVLSGGNIATESIFPDSWHADAMDAINMKAIHHRYGDRPLKSFSAVGFYQYYLWYPFVRKMKTVRPLNYMQYNKDSAIKEMEETIGWRPYGRKHGESLFTRLFQNYYLPTRFGYDKRRPHLSSLIVSGQITREEALVKLDEPLYDPQELEIDISYFCKKMQLTRDQFEELMQVPVHHYTDFPNWDSKYRLLKQIQAFCEKILNRNLGNYS